MTCPVLLHTVKTWSVQDAKARCSELLDACVSEGPQVITRRGAEPAALVSAADWKRLRDAARPSYRELLLSASARSNLVMSAPGRMKRRAAGLSGLSPGAKR